MIWGRPGSHIGAMAYFGILSLALLATSLKAASVGGTVLAGQLFLLIPHAVGLFALAVKQKWSYMYCSVVMCVAATFFTGSLLVILFKAKDVSIVSLLPSFIAGGALFFLFYRFAFGKASREFYSAGISSNSG